MTTKSYYSLFVFFSKTYFLFWIILINFATVIMLNKMAREKNKSKKVVEIRVNNKPYKTLKNLSDLDKFLRDFQDKNKYTSISETHSGSYGMVVYADYKKKKSLMLTWKQFIGFYDKNRKKLYYGDRIEDCHGNRSEIHQHYDATGDEGYYFRINGERWMEWKDYDITDFREYKKVKDVLDINL